VNLKHGLLVITALGFAVSAQTINLSGTVSNKSGKPISNAIVTLKGKKLADTTDTKGAYTITQGTRSVNPVAVIPHTAEIFLNNGNIWFNLAKPAKVSIDIFDISGNLLNHELTNYASEGKYQYKIANGSIASSMAAIRVSIGEHSSTFRYLQLPDGKHAISTSVTSMSSTTGGSLAKMEAAVDSLNVTAPHYASKVIAVSSFESVVNITLDTTTLENFSFFVTSLKALRELSGSPKGFGGDFRFGKTGPGAGLLGADSICQCIAEKSMPGSKVKQWRAFLSVKQGPDGTQVNAIDRIGNGPWYDRKGRLFANNISELLNDRPSKADVAIKNDFPNEDGIPNHRPDPNKPAVDNHLTVTGSDNKGKLYGNNCTCNDWTATTGQGGSKPRAGLAYPQAFTGGMKNWLSVWDLSGCQPGLDSLETSGAGQSGVYTIGNGGGYGGFYCFALNP
jgi:hypothetical protein